MLMKNKCGAFPSVAVGTTIADRPPHRTVRAALPHTAATSESSERCCYSHTAQSLGHSLPRSVSGEWGLNGVLLGPRPSLPRLRRRLLFFVRLVHRYYGAVRLLQSVRVRRVALGLRGPASFPFGPRRSRGLPVLVHVVSQRAQVLRLRRTDCSLAIIAKQPCCLPLIRRESASWFCVFRSSIARPTDTPV